MPASNQSLSPLARRGAAMAALATPNTKTEVDSDIEGKIQAAEQQRAKLKSALRILDESLRTLPENGDIAKHIKKRDVIRTYDASIQSEIRKLEWQKIANKQSNTLLEDQDAVVKLLDIQQEAATTTGVLAGIGASVSISIIFSSTRGDMSLFFAAWWCFLVSIIITYIIIMYTSKTKLHIARTPPHIRISNTHPVVKALRRQTFLLVPVITSLSLEVAGFALWAAACFDLDGSHADVSAAPNISRAVKIIGYVGVSVAGAAVCVVHLWLLYRASHRKPRDNDVEGGGPAQSNSTPGLPQTNAHNAPLDVPGVPIESHELQQHPQAI